MSLILYINGSVADLAPDTVIAQTRQVNDLNSIDNRQASYTNKFSLPKTANNVRIMNYLTLTGNTSNIPYQKNECSLYSATGECFVYNGWAVVTDGGDTYDMVIYDGIIDLYKAVENKTLSSLGLQEVQHQKNHGTIIESWTTDKPYSYILADYNGNTNPRIYNGENTINSDYLIPSVKVSYLWNRIFSGDYRAEGSIFSHPDFTNLWLTFPKAVPPPVSPNVIVYNGTTQGYTSIINSNQGAKQFMANMGFSNRPAVEGSPQVVNTNYLKITKSGRYRLDLYGYVRCMVPASNGFQSTKQTSRIYLVKNANNASLSNTPPWVEVGIFYYDNPVSQIIPLTLQENDTIGIVVASTISYNPGFYIEENGSNLSLNLTLLNSSVVDFAEAFSDFPIRDFITEIVQRFALTMHKDKYTNTYTFCTLAETMETAPVVNWTDKFINKIQEDYIYGSYAQQNWFRYTYNNKEQTHADGFLAVVNTNLPDTANVFKSKIYAPEKETSMNIGRISNVYKFWEKESEKDSENNTTTINYKPLDKRYYFMRAIQVINPNILLYSTVTNTTQRPSRCYVESFQGLPFNDIINTYYAPLTRVLQNSLIVKVQLWLSESDVANFDFKKKYYIAQLGGNFIMNKITNYIPGKPTTCEMVRVA